MQMSKTLKDRLSYFEDRASMNKEPLLLCALYKGQTHKKLHVERVGAGLLKHVVVSSWLKYPGIIVFHIMR